MHLEMHITKRNAYIAKQAKQFLLGLLYISHIQSLQI